MDRKDALFGYLLLVASLFVYVIITMIPNQELLSAFGVSVLVWDTIVATGAADIGVLVYLLRPVELPQIFIHKYLERRGLPNGFAMKFNYVVKTSKASIEGLELHVASGWGHPSGQTWANLDMREYDYNEAITGKSGEPVSQLSFLSHDSKEFTFVTFVLVPKEGKIERRATIRVVDPSKQWHYEDMDFKGLYPRIWIRFIGLPEKLEKEYVIVYNDPPWGRGAYHESVELLEADSERAKRLVAESEKTLADLRSASSSQGDEAK